jgi:AraC family transcriptional regulator of adaptative response/methylated-DNA-[protein]-cysteine methyltransferase
MDTVIENFAQLSQDYCLVEQAIEYLDARRDNQPSLGEVAEAVHLSEYHFQRLFARWVGISPKRFLQYLTKEHAKALLAGSASLMDAAYATGLSGPGRLHDLFIAAEAVTPGEFKQRGEGLTIQYGFHHTPFGECLLAQTGRGICSLGFVTESRETSLEGLGRAWPLARLVEAPEETGKAVTAVFARFTGEESVPLHLFLQGTNFQIKVWEALLNIPAGQVISYEGLAEQVNAPRASRAVGHAVARNPVPLIIPCHRVIRKVGAVGEYHWGRARKLAILGWEAARLETPGFRLAKEMEVG